MLTNHARRLAAAIIVPVMILSAGAAGAASISPVATHMVPQIIVMPGICKSASERGFGTSPLAAVASWQAVVTAKYGAAWANWAKAKNKSLTNPVGSRWIAEGRPCL